VTKLSPDDLASIDGEILPAHEATIAVTDDGLVRGDGVFEVIRVYSGRPYALDEHLDRIARSIANLRMSWSAAREELEEAVRELLDARGGTAFDGQLRIILTAGGRRILTTEPVPEHAEQIRVGYVTYAPTRILDGIKSLSYASNMLCTRVAKERGFDEALLVTPHGRVLEAPTSSLFWVDPRGELVTPPLDDHILASITRARVIELTGAVERVTTADDLLRAREAFLASTTREVQSIRQIEDRDLGAVGERTLQAADLFRQDVEASLGAA
jgi:branched-subunit amino acid aminotransferase/4-amino-4-deoxychorismate lyase